MAKVRLSKKLIGKTICLSNETGNTTTFQVKDVDLKKQQIISVDGCAYNIEKGVVIELLKTEKDKKTPPTLGGKDRDRFFDGMYPS